MRRDEEIRMRHMLDAAREALGFIRGRSRADLSQDRMLALAVVKEIEIVGEAALKVSSETRQAYPELPWEDIAGMRHRLIHAYFDINLDIVWRTLQEDLPSLIATLEGIVPPQTGVVDRSR
jgi:uncharacterized protein with HEPN domain